MIDNKTFIYNKIDVSYTVYNIIGNITFYLQQYWSYTVFLMKGKKTIYLH